MKAKIIGYAHLKGYSEKKKKDYDFYQLSATFRPEEGYTGERVLDLTVDPAQVEGIEKASLPITCEITKDFVTNRTFIHF